MPSSFTLETRSRLDAAELFDRSLSIDAHVASMSHTDEVAIGGVTTGTITEGETVTLTAKQRMLTPEQVASLTGVSRSTISRKIKAGEIHAVKVGNRNRIPYDEYQRWWDQAMGDVIELVRDALREDLFGTR